VSINQAQPRSRWFSACSTAAAFTSDSTTKSGVGSGSNGSTHGGGGAGGGAIGRRPGFFVQLGALVSREFMGVVRNKPALIARFGISSFLNLFFALIFYKVGTGSTG
jgi:hypothetical protein